MNTSANGYAIIKRFESLTLQVKGDTGGKQEIGYGHDLTLFEAYPHGITEDYAETLLCEDVIHVEHHLNPMIPVSCTQNQYDALIDFAYECGTGALNQLLSHGWNDVPNQLLKWVHAHVNGKVVELPGMIMRRQKEVDMWNS